MAYRELVDSLAARFEVLEQQVSDRTRERDEVARLLAEARDRVQREEAAAARPMRRRRLRRWLVALASAVVVICGVVAFVHARKAPDQTAVALHRMEGFTFEMCACADETCAVKVADEMTGWAQAYAREQPSPKLDAASMTIATALAETMANCMQHSMHASR
ncbi:MAG TPA: hypothetical protein VMJ10_16475 [Kofleriaceae bacterium]|nr:hypothetical protein [Kofleriaceae bacterium]